MGSGALQANRFLQLAVSVLYEFCWNGVKNLLLLLLSALCRKLKLEDAYQHHRFLTDAREHVRPVCYSY